MSQEKLIKYGFEVHKIRKGVAQEFPGWTKTLNKITAKELLNKEFVILEYVVGHSHKFNTDFAMLRIVLEKKQERLFITSSGVLIGQLEENKANLPLLVKLVKQDKYYLFE